MAPKRSVWVAAGLRTPFTRVDGGLAKRDAIRLGVPVLQAMAGQVEKGARIDFAVRGSVIPNLGYSNIARETWVDAKLDPTVPATTNVMACVGARILSQTVKELAGARPGTRAIVSVCADGGVGWRCCSCAPWTGRCCSTISDLDSLADIVLVTQDGIRPNIVQGLDAIVADRDEAIVNAFGLHRPMDGLGDLQQRAAIIEGRRPVERAE